MRKRVTAAQRNEYTPALTQRNLIQILFHDRLQQPCSLEEGLPTDGDIPTLMFGAAQPPHNGPALSRVDLDQQIVKDLLPFLHHFVETGKLPGLPNTAQDHPSHHNRRRNSPSFSKYPNLKDRSRRTHALGNRISQSRHPVRSARVPENRPKKESAHRPRSTCSI